MKLTNATQINKGSLIGKFDLEMPSGLKIIGVMLFEKNGRRWVSFPSKEYTGLDGLRKYHPLLGFIDRPTAEKFQAAVLPLAERELLAEAVR